MPNYDYFCEANGQTIEVSHPVTDKLLTWGELCECAGIDPGETPTDSPIKRLLNGGAIAGSKQQSTFTPAATRRDSGHTCGPGCNH